MSAPVALVTGASRGIGKRLCADLARAGYDVVCAARSSAEHPSKLPGTVEETAKLVTDAGHRAWPVALDVRDEDAVRDLVERIHAEWGRIDLVVNNAAVAPEKPALEDSTKRWRLALDVNVNGPFYVIYYAAPRMAAAGGGRIINVSSSAAVLPEFGRASYTVTKTALEALTATMAHDLREKQVAVNTLRLDLMVWTEGFAATLGDPAAYSMEDAVIMSDAVLWMAKQPLAWTGHLETITSLRAKGAVRGITPATK
ncbi:MAG: SDR family NAD(P)-dependent oxidoreductase [Myxococcota bacterium]|nr:SDR family NAD(P)-dependent oxidoreductase [Myxococcota bacterium]